LLFLCASAGAQTIAPFYSGSYSLTSLTFTGVPIHYGGMIFKAGDPNTLIIGGAANEASGRFYEVPVVRGAGNHIVAFGTPVVRGFGANNDGGIAYGPGGVLFYSKYDTNAVGQVKPGSNADDKVVALGPLGVLESPGGLNFVPAGYNGAGQLKVLSWYDGQFYTVTLAADGSGTYNLTGATHVATLGGGTEGFAYVPLGSPLFGSQSMLVSEYSDDNVAAYTIDANGNPVPGSRRTFIAGLEAAEGVAIDPLTGDFLFSTCGCGAAADRIIAVRGFTLPGTAPAVDLNQHGLTGSWYESATSGQGFAVQVIPNQSPGNGLAFVSWFTFDTLIGGAERQRWYTLQGPVVTGQPTASLTIYQNTGGNFNAPPATEAQAVGTATLSFDTCSLGELSYSFSDGTGRAGTVPLTRLLPNVTCSVTTTYPTNADFAFSGSWYGGAATSGQGFTAEVAPNINAFFLSWFTYMPNGVNAGAAGQRWYTAQGAFTPGLRTIPVQIYETTGGRFDTATPPGQTTVPVGTGTMAFQSCSAATFSYNFTGGTSIGSSGTITLGRVGPVPPGCAQ